jgi:hypothetical protein
MKWKNILIIVMVPSFSQHMKNGLACKDKWGSIFKEFKKIFDYMSRTWHNEDYW